MRFSDETSREVLEPGTASRKLAIVVGQELPSAACGWVSLWAKSVGKVDCSFVFSKTVQLPDDDVFTVFQRTFVASVINCNTSSAVPSPAGFLIVVVDHDDDIDVDFMRTAVQPSNPDECSAFEVSFFL